MERVIFASYGNDSIALIQWTHEHGYKDVTVAYSDTGWAADFWEERVTKAEEWCKSLGYNTVRIDSEGMVSLVRRKKAWPRGGGGRFQFCTVNLKIKPALEWLDSIDQDKEVICMVGIRREESLNRSNFPEWTEESENHGGRSLHAPLVAYTEFDRDYLISKTPFTPLHHRSKECWPCVNVTVQEKKFISGDKLNLISELEKEMGKNSKGNDRVMFSPDKNNGAIGIHAVVENALKNQDDMFGGYCDGGWCGTQVNAKGIKMSETPNIEDARKIGEQGAKGAGFYDFEAERLAFEAWMERHCWCVSGEWNGETYINKCGGPWGFDPASLQNRQLWAAWRDRAALAGSLTYK